jgi:acetoin utilization deacetylase AcuC-like enzyme
VDELALAHDRDYIARVVEGRLDERELRRLGLPWSPELVERARRSVGATIAVSRAALEAGIAASLGGGTHHAFPDHGQGFCIFNDVAVAARCMQRENRIRRAVVIDCDVHQGNGTAAIFHGDDSVFTFSIHGEKNFPFHKEQSDLDIALPDGAEDDVYLSALQEGLNRLMLAGSFDLAYYLAGADPYAGDRLGRMRVSKAGLAQRDRLVLQACRLAGLPVALTMSGGYAHDVDDIAEIHAETIRIAKLEFEKETL